MSTTERLAQRFIDDVRELHSAAVQRDAKVVRIKTSDLALLIEMADRKAPEAVIDLRRLADFAGIRPTVHETAPGYIGIAAPDQPLPPGTVLCGREQVSHEMANRVTDSESNT